MPENNTSSFRVFLSYASEDRDRANDLFQKLTNDGVNVWMDVKKLLPGQEWKHEIAEALEASHAILVCLSKKAVVKEGYVQKEIKDALDKAEEKPEGTIFLIPIRWDDCAVPRRIAGKQYVDLFSSDGYQKLIMALGVRATSLGFSFTRQKIIQELQPDNSYELHSLLQNMLRDDNDLHEALLHLKSRESDENGWFHREIRTELQKIMSDHNHSVMKRTKAGEALAVVGDPRFRKDHWYLPNDESLGFVEIPAGPFLMGNSSTDNHHSIVQPENPQHLVDLPFYFINRYPVTVDQYHAYLTDANLLEMQKYGQQGIGNQPVVDISWQEAMKYCTWLTGKLRNLTALPEILAEKMITKTWAVTLPSEAEWEKAARGIADNRVYAWGAIANPDFANYKDTNLRRINTVGCFEAGQSPFGIHDLCGNVWEWTRSNWGSNTEKPKFKYPYLPQDDRENLEAPDNMLRVIRGGSCHSPEEDIRCYHRGADYPDAKRSHVGFRLVINLLSQQE